MTWWGNLAPRPLILFKWFNTAPLYSFKLMGPKFKLRSFKCHVSWKRIHGALNLHCSSYISKIVWWLPMFDFGIFCHLLRLMGIFFFFFFFFFFFLFFILFFPLSRGPFSSGAPGHCPPMPPSRYATAGSDLTSSLVEVKESRMSGWL